MKSVSVEHGRENTNGKNTNTELWMALKRSNVSANETILNVTGANWTEAGSTSYTQQYMSSSIIPFLRVYHGVVN